MCQKVKRKPTYANELSTLYSTIISDDMMGEHDYVLFNPTRVKSWDTSTVEEFSDEEVVSLHF